MDGRDRWRHPSRPTGGDETRKYPVSLRMSPEEQRVSRAASAELAGWGWGVDGCSCLVLYADCPRSGVVAASLKRVAVDERDVDGRLQSRFSSESICAAAASLMALAADAMSFMHPSTLRSRFVPPLSFSYGSSPPPPPPPPHPPPLAKISLLQSAAWQNVERQASRRVPARPRPGDQAVVASGLTARTSASKTENRVAAWVSSRHLAGHPEQAGGPVGGAAGIAGVMLDGVPAPRTASQILGARSFTS